MSNKPSIPAWQSAATGDGPYSSASASQDETAQSPEAPAPTPTEDDIEEPVQAPTPTEDDVRHDESDTTQWEKTSLLDQAARFLDDASIRDAPRDKKVAFLESKGVKPEDIETLLGSSEPSVNTVDLEDAGQRAWSTTPAKTTAVAESTPPPPPREIPPIVTYPEFLAQTEKPPPLITTQRLVTTAYVTGGLMASIYGLSRYVLAPMTHSLADARHDFAQHTASQLSELNTKLASSVSIDPASLKRPTTSSSSTNGADNILDDSVSEADSDPTELFHRDFGTQTTPNLSRRPSTSSSSTPSNDPHPTVTAHEKRLKIIKSHLQELEASRSADSLSRAGVRTKVSDLSAYLSEMSYQNQYYSNMGGFYGGGSGSNGGGSGMDGMGLGGKKGDQIEVVKGDIRAIKGVFLSARMFPAGGR